MDNKMREEKDPAFLFYPEKFITGALTMNWEQRGKYIYLLCLQHQKGGFLTEKDMLSICGAYDEDVFCKFKQENGKYYNERLLSEIKKREAYSQSRSSNARRSKETNQNNLFDNSEHMPSTCEAYAEHSINININKDISSNNEIKVKRSKLNLGERIEAFRTKVYGFESKYKKTLLDAFIDYWTECNDGGWIMRWETKDRFDTARRLATWFKNENKFTTTYEREKFKGTAIGGDAIFKSGRKFGKL